MLILKSEKGYTLIIVLWSIVILTIIFSYLLDDFYLDSFLLEEYSQQQNLKEAALSAYNIGLNLLLNDETKYDLESDNWVKEISGSINDIEYTVNIKDVGSRINLNYDNLYILNELDDWDRDVNNIDEIEVYLEEEILADILFLKEIISENNYQLLLKYATTFGKFNVNQDPPQKLNKILYLLDLDYAVNNSLSDSLQDLREEGEEINNLDELPLLIDGIGSIYEDIEPYLCVEGRININLVDEEILKAIAKFCELNETLVESVMTYREEKEIKNIEDLNSLLGDQDFNKIKGFLTTHSTFLEFNIYVETTEKKGYSIKSIVKRSFQENKWLVDVLSWSENEVFPEVINNGDTEI